jgi:hypothetical protein
MQIGKLKNENNHFLENYKTYGFGNKTKMLDFALDLLREKMKKENRRKEREKVLNEYAESTPENYFSTIDGDNFE